MGRGTGRAAANDSIRSTMTSHESQRNRIVRPDVVAAQLTVTSRENSRSSAFSITRYGVTCNV